MTADKPRGRAIGRRRPTRPAALQTPAPEVRPEGPTVVQAAPLPVPDVVQDPDFQDTIAGVSASHDRMGPSLEGDAVPLKDRRRRTLGAAFGTFGVLLLTLAALVYAWLPDPPRPEVIEEAEPELISQAVADQTLGGKPIRVRRPVVRPPPSPADAVINLPEHTYSGPWALRCPRINGVTPIKTGRVEKGQRRVLVPQVPPTACRVSFPSSGWREVNVTAGVRRSCRMDGNLICR